ncbi:MAG: hypothetical protein MUF71_06965 [Candidatus Kapabacteria bacterium]|jgi:hypothetical protein|nr:hypothetical protein [Candidatus Kapabacteria bacterium]
MAALEISAQLLGISPTELLRSSLLMFVQHRLQQVEAELFILAKKYGVRTIAEFDAAVQQGTFSEAFAHDDYFRFDNLEAECDALKNALGNIRTESMDTSVDCF